MKFFNKFLKKEEKEEEYHNIDENGNRINTSIDEITDKKNKLNIENLNLEELYQLKESIEERIEKLHSDYGLTDEISVNKKEEKVIFEEEINEPVDENFLNNETLEIDEDMIIDDEYLQFGEEEKTSEEKVSHEVTHKIEEEEILDKIKAYFGENNVFYETRNDLKHEALKGKEVYCIGIRAKEAYNDDEFDLLKQNSWFIRNIKKLDELKNFKMINSSNVEKNLVWDKADHAVLICYKSINILKNPNEFNFN